MPRMKSASSSRLPVPYTLSWAYATATATCSKAAKAAANGHPLRWEAAAHRPARSRRRRQQRRADGLSPPLNSDVLAWPCMSPPRPQLPVGAPNPPCDPGNRAEQTPEPAKLLLNKGYPIPTGLDCHSASPMRMGLAQRSRSQDLTKYPLRACLSTIEDRWSEPLS